MRDRPDVEVFDDGLIIASGVLTAAVARMGAVEYSDSKELVWVNRLRQPAREA
jgi:hypothetical protein